MEESVLVSIKGMLGIGEDCDSFDNELIVFINSAFSTLYQVGFNPALDYRIESEDDKWSDIVNDDPDLMDLIKPYVYMRVRMLFDPPTSSFVLNSLESQMKEYEWRIQTQSEGGFDVDEGECFRTPRRPRTEVGCT